MYFQEEVGWVGGGQGGGAAGIIAEMPSVLLNNGQGEEINRLSKYQTCLLSELNDVSRVTTATSFVHQTPHFNSVKCCFKNRS